MPSRSWSTQAFLLRAIDYNEADRIVTFFTQEQGRISAIARGARRSQRRFGGALQAYTLVDAVFRSTRGNLVTLSEVRAIRTYPNILKDLDRIRAAGTALAVVRELTPERAADTRIFDAMHTMLEAMEETTQPSSVLLAFCVRMLALVGFPPALDVCSGCGKRPLEGQPALFSPSAGSIVCRACGGGAIRIGAATRDRWLSAQGEAWVPTASWEPALQDEALNVIISFSDHHLGAGLRRTLDGLVS